MKHIGSMIGMLLLLLAVPAVACTGGQEWTSDVGMYTTDVTNDTPLIYPAQTVHFDFALINNSDPAFGPQEIIPYSHTQVTLTHGSDNIFTKDLPYQREREQAGFDYKFPNEHANYKLAIRYMNGTKELAATTIPLVVGKGDGHTGVIIAIITAVVLSLLVGTKTLRFRR